MFSIGAFSRLSQLSIRVLRHYDEIGLLEPAHTDPRNGYRYYRAEQLADVHRIVALKDLGLGLEQVRAVMQEKHSLEAISGMLHLEKIRAERERSEAERKLRELDRRLAELADLGRLSAIDIVEKRVEAAPFLAHRSTVADMEAAMTLMHEIVARCQPFAPRSPFVGVAHDTFFDTEDLDLEMGYLVGSPERVDLGAGRVMTVRELPAVERMLCVVYLGSQDDGHRRTHHAIAVWLERHLCELAGPGRELVHDEQTIEIQYPIRALTRD
jgi:DNA-binding transcriptional MerR regulator